MVDVIPKYINSPLDILADNLVDLMLSISLKVAHADGKYSDEESARIDQYFVNEWGYCDTFIESRTERFKTNLDAFRYKDLCVELKKLTKLNKDCNYKEMCSDIVRLAEEIAHADGHFCEKEEIEIEYLRRSLLTN
ncbi:MAG: TerB family tellurite resistance protein [Motiliproteus sp.]